MTDIKFVTADNLKSLEQYGAALICGMLTIRTQESFHIAAYEKGLFEEDEEECSKTICYELRRLMALYKKQMENILERCEIDENQVIEALRTMAPDVKKPRKRKT